MYVITFLFIQEHVSSCYHKYIFGLANTPDSKAHGSNMGPTWVLSAPDGSHVGPMNLAIRATHVYLWYISIHVISASVFLPHSGRSRLVLCLLWLMVITTLASYSATLRYYLTVDIRRLPISSLKQAIQSPKYKIRMSTESVFAEIFNASNIVCVVDLWSFWGSVRNYRYNQHSVYFFFVIIFYSVLVNFH